VGHIVPGASLRCALAHIFYKALPPTLLNALRQKGSKLRTLRKKIKIPTHEQDRFRSIIFEYMPRSYGPGSREHHRERCDNVLPRCTLIRGMHIQCWNTTVLDQFWKKKFYAIPQSFKALAFKHIKSLFQKDIHFLRLSISIKSLSTYKARAFLKSAKKKTVNNNLLKV